MIMLSIILGIVAVFTAWSVGIMQSRLGSAVTVAVVMTMVIAGYAPALVLFGDWVGIAALAVMMGGLTEFYFRLLRAVEPRSTTGIDRQRAVYIQRRLGGLFAGIQLGRLRFAVAWEGAPC